MRSQTPLQLRYPGGKRFAFTIFDDCDNSTVENTRPFYALLEQLGMRTTKTVWSVGTVDAHPHWRGSSTLENPEYREFAQELRLRGFEIAFHGASMMSSRRDQTRRALEVFRQTFGDYPRSYSNHGSNQENLYWSDSRFRFRLLRSLYFWAVTRNGHYSQGHVPGSPYFWGDLCRAHIDYVRGFTFPVTNLFSINRNILYRDPATIFVKFWFCACHAAGPEDFNRLLHPRRQETLAQGGLCIIGTHGARFTSSGEVNLETRRLLELIAMKDGWFVPVSTLLDYLRLQGFGGPILPRDRRMLELRWFYHAMRRGWGS